MSIFTVKETFAPGDACLHTTLNDLQTRIALGCDVIVNAQLAAGIALAGGQLADAPNGVGPAELGALSVTNDKLAIGASLRGSIPDLSRGLTENHDGSQAFQTIFPGQSENLPTLPGVPNGVSDPDGLYMAFGGVLVEINISGGGGATLGGRLKLNFTGESKIVHGPATTITITPEHDGAVIPLYSVWATKNKGPVVADYEMKFSVSSAIFKTLGSTHLIAVMCFA